MNITSYIIDNSKSNGDNIIEVIGGLLTKTNESECVDGSDICSSKQVIKLINQFVNVNDEKPIKNEKEIIKKAESKLKCNSESCILVNPIFNKFVKQELGDNNILKYELSTKFKTHGPRYNTNLLSNFNIDETLMLWAREFKTFYPCPFSMIDFKTISNDFCTTNLVDVIEGRQSYEDPIEGIKSGPFKTYGCVLNTDVSTGKGKHWVCIFVDCRSDIWTIEYFNSAGNPPHYDVNEWMEQQRNYLLRIHNKVETITVTNIVHQKSNTECGMYVLYYIRSRLDGIPYTYFLTKRIDDSDVTKFRKHVFRKH